MNDDQGRKLIQEAAGSYLQALYAIREFRREVQQTCTEIVKKRLPELAECIGIPRDEKMVVPYAFPEKLTDWDGEIAEIGVKVAAREGSVFFTYALEWELQKGESPSTSVMAYVSARTIKAAAALLADLKKTGHPHPRLEHWQYWVYMWKPVDAGRIGDFDQLLDEVVGEWCHLWRDAGGLDKLIPVSSVQSSPPAP